jgi:hypothetical protein
VESKDWICLVIDHLLSDVHVKTVEHRKLHDSWKLASDDHPWMKILRKYEGQVLEFAIRLAFDVYNDCL